MYIYVYLLELEKEYPKKIVENFKKVTNACASGTLVEKKLFYRTNKNNYYYYFITWIIFAFIHIINVVKFTVYTHAR